jgi:hypothetical protein
VAARLDSERVATRVWPAFQDGRWLIEFERAHEGAAARFVPS